MRKFLCCVVLFVSTICFSFNVSADNQAETDVSAAAYIVMDAATRSVIYESNAHLKLPMASTTKIMSTLLCLESGDLDSEFVVDSDAIHVEGSSMGLVDGDIVTKRALCYGMLLPSGNDAAGATAVKLAGSYSNFASLMNERAKQIGMDDTHFVTPSGLHDENHYSTAYDMGILTAEAIRNDDFREICSKESAKVTFGNPPFERWLKNTNKLLQGCEGVIGVKTGFTDEAGRCLVSACTRDDVTLICVTLNDKNDWNDHSQLYDLAFSSITAKYADIPEDVRLPVAGGEKSSVKLYAKSDVVYGETDVQNNDVRWEIEAAPMLYAPVKADSIAGYLIHYCGDFEVSRQPLYVVNDVLYCENNDESKNLFEKISEKLREFFS